MTVQLVIFAKAPVVGRVKTRLARALGAEAACEVAMTLLRQTFDIAQKTGLPCHLFVDDFHPLFATTPWPIYRQIDGDLGERMAAVFTELFSTHDRVLLIGSDIASLTVVELQQAAAKLSQTEAVIGPALDGGYWAIGLHRRLTVLLSQLFAPLPWGTETVFQNTVTRLQNLNVEWKTLTDGWDVDDFSDYQRYLRDITS